MTPAPDLAAGPLQGAFLLQQNGSINGQAVFSIILPGVNGGTPTTCNSGSASVTGTISGQSVNLTAAVGTLDSQGNPATQTFTLSGTLSSDNSAIQGGTYSLTDGYYSSAGIIQPCGSAQNALSWNANSVPSITGPFQGFFHSRVGTLSDQDFAVSGSLTQGPNIGASYATVTGTLIFKDPATQLNDYPCMAATDVTGQISGDVVTLQMYGGNGLVVGEIGGTPPQASPVTYGNTSGGLVLQDLSATAHGYSLTTSGCHNGDAGDVCLAFGGATGCTQPITISPFSLTFAPQVLASQPARQTITITNNTSAPLNGVTMQFAGVDSGIFYQTKGGGGGDFNGALNFGIVPTGRLGDCANVLPVGLQTACTVTIEFTPQESCPWLPLPSLYGGPPDAENPALCPHPLAAGLTVTVPSGTSKDSDNSFAMPVTGIGLSAIAPSTGELDFGAEAVGEASSLQTVTFTNQSTHAVQILPGANACASSSQQQTLPYFLGLSSNVAGLQIVRQDAASNHTIVPDLTATPPTVFYYCDYDALGKQPNFQISPGSTCPGLLVQPQQTCTVQVSYVPQPSTDQNGISGTGLDYFLEFNTVQCGSGESNCEIDSGRFPVEITANPPSPLRLIPGAGLEFGAVTKGTLSTPLTVKLFNDPADPNSATVTLAGKLVSGDYTETDDCPSNLAPNGSCTLTITFTPKVVGIDDGSIVVSYNTPAQVGLVQKIYMRGMGQ